jgi:hypothetical protein
MKNPTTGCGSGVQKTFVEGYNPTAARRSSSALDSSRFNLPFTPPT